MKSTKESFKLLKDKGFITYNCIIPREIIEEVLVVQFHSSMKWFGPFLQLKEKIEKHGFFSTTSGCKEGSLRILPLEKMAERSEHILELLRRKQKRTHNTLREMDSTSLKESERAEYQRALQKSIFALQSLKSILRDI